MQFTYEVHPGETLDEIARRFDTTVSDILAINEIPNPHGPFRVRIVIRIPVAMLPPTVPTKRPLTNFAARLVGHILYVLSTDRMLYRSGQPVHITLVKTNVGEHPITLTYPTTQRFDFFVRRSRTGPVIWQWSAGRLFAQVVETVVLQPSQSQVFRAAWDQIGNDGLPVGTGIFTVTGENVAQELRGQTISVRIRII
jgi:LysM repeat protein